MSIKTKLLIICVAVVLIVMIVSGSFMLQSVKANETQKSRWQLMAYANSINELILQAYEKPDEFMTAPAWDTLTSGAYGIQGCILNSVGQPVAPYAFLRLRVNDSAVVAAISGEEGFVANKHAPDLNETEKEWMCYAKPVTKGETKYIIYTRMSAEPMNENMAQLTFTIVMMVLVAVTLSGALWFVFAVTLTKPITALTHSAKELAAGNLQGSLPTAIAVQSQDEIGQLTDSFNHMAKEINHNLSAIAREKNKSEAVLHNMTDGVLAYDAAGNIIHANNASTELLQFEDIQTANVNEMLPRLGFSMKEVYRLSPEMIQESTIPVGDRFITASVTPYTNQFGVVDGFVIVLQDVTKHTKLDNMRKEFVANVSHELRTPLSSVMACAETLLDGAINDESAAMQFLKIIENETQRMSVLVTDLLELSRLDNKQTVIEKEVVDLAGLLRLAVKQNQLIADKKNQHIVYHPPGKPYFIEANAVRINQVFSNILTNSTKYSPEDTEIEVVTEETDKYFRVFIKDHGIGIPKNDIPHIFERFYRVDKARSRAMGGTGLGLAIAKEIMEEHGGRINVSSEFGNGTTMVLRFPKYKESTAPNPNPKPKSKSHSKSR